VVMNSARLNARLAPNTPFQSGKRVPVYNGCLRKSKRAVQAFAAPKRAAKRALSPYGWISGIGMPSHETGGSFVMAEGLFSARSTPRPTRTAGGA
jgi:hypothetical protein